MAEWTMATDCKSVSIYSRWFESSFFHLFQSLLEFVVKLFMLSVLKIPNKLLCSTSYSLVKPSLHFFSSRSLLRPFRSKALRFRSRSIRSYYYSHDKFNWGFVRFRRNKKFQVLVSKRRSLYSCSQTIGLVVRQPRLFVNRRVRRIINASFGVYVNLFS